jgi:hypothetical protein
VLAVHGGRVDRGLQVALAVRGEAQEELRGPLVLLIATRRAEASQRPSASCASEGESVVRGRLPGASAFG